VSVAEQALRAVRIGFAARTVRKSRTEEERQQALKALATLFADARGVTMKFGQLFAGHDVSSPLAELTTSVQPAPLEEIRPAIEAGIGRSTNQVFLSIDESDAAASLGQVHHAVLKNGNHVAVKVQYPGIAQSVDAELKLAGLIPRLGPARKWDFAMDGYRAALAENLDRELDYRSEARRQSDFFQKVRVQGLVVPRVHDEFTSRTTLVQDWATGVRLADVLQWTADERNEIGRILLATLFTSLFEHGEVHGDPHPGNFLYRKNVTGDPEVVLLDYGCTLPVDRAARLSLLKLILGLRAKMPLPWLSIYGAMGFDAAKLSRIAGALPIVSRILFHPFLAGQPFCVSQWDLRKRFESALGEDRWWFRSAGAPSIILLLRAFHGVAQQLDLLKARLDWMQILESSVSRRTFRDAENLAPPDVQGVAHGGSGSEVASSSAVYLKVLVEENGREIAAITLPSEAALNLETLMPSDVVRDVQGSGEFDLEAAHRRLRATGLRPQEILRRVKGDRSLRVWLE